tara:strand:+ start:7821 stop:8432 length:612 start_codon:yes stop_codon:yes gene_type:complete
MSLVPIATLKEYLPEISGNSADTELSNLIDRIEQAVARYLGFIPPNDSTLLTLDESTYTIYVDRPMISDEFVLQLPIKPLVSVSSVHSDINRKYDSNTLLDSSKYSVDKANARIVLDDTSPDTFDSGYQATKVVGNFGYSTSSPPSDLVHSICVWCAHVQRAKSSQGNQSITQRNSTINLSPRTMPPEVREILRGYRNANTIL